MARLGATVRIAPVVAAPAPDRVPDEMAGGTPEPLRSDLIGLLGPDRVLTRVIDLVRFATDASPYRRLPKAIVVARDADDIAKVFAYGARTGTPVTLRGGGTSISGQAQTHGILVDVRRHLRGVEVLDGGERVRVQPGTLLGYINRILAPHGRRMGPDPASTDIATVGAVIANNSGGMRCGTTADSYCTLESLTFVLPSGTSLDTAAPDAAERFAREEPELAAGLAEIRDTIHADAQLSERIRRKFQIKNTTGYRLCAFLDADEPLEIFKRLLVGSEGTLALIAEAVMRTMPVPRRTAVAWVHLPDIATTCAPVPALVGAGATAVELMVAPALMAASYSIPGASEAWRELPLESAALLVELGADDEEGLAVAERAATEALAGHDPIRPIEWFRDHERIEAQWRVREGLHGLLGRIRPEGTALIVEDVCVEPAKIAAAAEEIRALLGKHGYLTGVAGHASAGNLHFMLTPRFSERSDLETYSAFMEDLVALIVDGYDGSLKSEHGTGINMAPFVAREWGAHATELMWRVKTLADPHGVLAPDVILSRTPDVHLQDLRTVPDIEEVATRCVECGFCEPVCPSRDLTTTPRERIVIRREMARQPPGSPVLEALLADYEYDAIQTCAADSTCAIACPLAIDTGKLIKDFRDHEHGAAQERAALSAARRFAVVERLARGGLRAGDAVARGVGDGPLSGLSGAARAALGRELVPAWPANMPRPAPAKLPATERSGAAAVYMPACVNRIFGVPRASGGDAARDRGRAELTVAEALVALSARAGLPVWIPGDVTGRCCGTPWTSKGYREGARHMARETFDALWRWSDAGTLPVVIDASSCAHGLGEELAGLLDDERRERHAKLQILDSIAWAHDRLLPRLTVAHRLRTVALHPTCATRRLGLAEQLHALGAALADEVVVPPSSTCCGFAGDRGFLHPELTAAATAPLAAELAGRDLDACLCSNRPCEIGLQQATGDAWTSFAVALEAATRP